MLREGQKVRTNVYEVTCPGFNSPVIAKFARFEWEVPQLEVETAAYSWVDGHGIGPVFLGHLTEEDRVIDFLITRIDGCRHATIEDLPLCRSALSRLHRLGIKHGDINKHNFLIHDGEATLIDFDRSLRLADENGLQAELQQLQVELCGDTGRGRMVVESSLH